MPKRRQDKCEEPAITEAESNNQESLSSNRGGDDDVLRRIAVLLERGQAVPIDLEERGLRIHLSKWPHNFELTYSLVALLHRNGRSPLPDQNVDALDPGADIDSTGLGLLEVAAEYAGKGDTYGVYAALWQIVVRYPRSVRGWAEFARAFADRAEWEYCRLALHRSLTLKSCYNIATADLLLQALGTLAEYKELGDLPWREWSQTQPKMFEAAPGAVQLLLRTGNTKQSKKIAARLVRRRPERADTWLAAAKVAYELGNLPACYNYMHRALELDLRGVLHSIMRDSGSAFAFAVNELGKEAELADWLSDQSRCDDVNLIPQWPNPESLASVRRLRSVAMDRGLPSAFLITQAKSASVTIGNIFSSGFALPTAVYSFVNTGIVESWLRDFMLGGATYVTHLRPTDRNIELLHDSGVKNVIVHIRDPRQQLLSLIHHFRRYPETLTKSQRESLGKNDPEQVFSNPMDKSFFADTIWWIDTWYKARDKVGLKFTIFEDFIRDRGKFTEKIVSLYGGDTQYFNSAVALGEHAGIDYHKRLGAIDEWRAVLSPKQIAEVNSLIPSYFWEAFGWEP